MFKDKKGQDLVNEFVNLIDAFIKQDSTRNKQETQSPITQNEKEEYDKVIESIRKNGVSFNINEPKLDHNFAKDIPYEVFQSDDDVDKHYLLRIPALYTRGLSLSVGEDGFSVVLSYFSTLPNIPNYMQIAGVNTATIVKLNKGFKVAKPVLLPLSSTDAYLVYRISVIN